MDNFKAYYDFVWINTHLKLNDKQIDRVTRYYYGKVDKYNLVSMVNENKIEKNLLK